MSPIIYNRYFEILGYSSIQPDFFLRIAPQKPQHFKQFVVYSNCTPHLRPPFTGASGQGFALRLTPSLNLPAPGRCQSLYILFRSLQRHVFLLNSRRSLFIEPPTSCDVRGPLLPKLRGNFAEFLNEGSFERLRIFSSSTCVGLRYGRSSD